MDTRQAIGYRIQQLCASRGMTVGGAAKNAGIPPMTVYSMLNGKSQNPGVVNIKKLCDGFDITLREFFDTPEFEKLEQEIK